MAAVRTRPEIGADSARLRLNRVLNLGGKTGRAAGNALGVLGLFYASAESGLDYLNDGRAPDVASPLGAGGVAVRRVSYLTGPTRASCRNVQVCLMLGCTS